MLLEKINSPLDLKKLTIHVHDECEGGNSYTIEFEKSAEYIDY
jgi:hypothetical protein